MDGVKGNIGGPPGSEALSVLVFRFFGKDLS